MIDNLKKVLKNCCFVLIAAAAFSSCGRNVELYEYNRLADSDTKEAMTVSAEETITVPVTTSLSTAAVETVTTTVAVTEKKQGQAEPRVTINKTMPSGFKLPEKHTVDFKTVLQNPELPTGCEITSLAQTLRYCKFDVDKVELCDNYLNIDVDGIYSLQSAFVGNPHDYMGMGCNACVLVDAANEYFGSLGSDWRAMDLTGVSFDDLLFHLAEGRPVVTIVTLSLMYATPQNMYVTVSGEDMVFTNLQHCMTMYGYDKEKGIIYTADPMRGNVEYNLEQYRTVYETMGKQAMVVYGDEITAGASFRTKEEISEYIEDLKERRKEEKAVVTSKKEETTTAQTVTTAAETTAAPETTTEPVETTKIPETTKAVINIIEIPKTTKKAN